MGNYWAGRIGHEGREGVGGARGHRVHYDDCGMTGNCEGHQAEGPRVWWPYGGSLGTVGDKPTIPNSTFETLVGHPTK